MTSILDQKLPYLPGKIRILQFGQGNFLRAFVDDFIDQMNEKGVFSGSVAVVKTTKGGDLSSFRKQNNRYTLCIRGMEQGKPVEKKRIIGCIAKTLSCHEEPEAFWELAALPSLRFVLSNTTEAGIRLQEGDAFEEMPESFPGKLTKFLHRRYRHFEGAVSAGLVLLPTELIEQNGRELKRCVREQSRLWGLEEDFLAWIDSACLFCDTLVDRIVSGYPKTETLTEYEDLLTDVCEPFASFVIAAPDSLRMELPLEQAGLPVTFTGDVAPYRERKVRILNGAHTCISPLGVLCALSTVEDCMNTPAMKQFLLKVLEQEIKPFVPLGKAEVDSFAASVLERFENPFLKHQLLSICLNSISKFKARLLGSFRDYYRARQSLPQGICFAFAALLRFYQGEFADGGSYLGRRPNEESYLIKDDEQNLSILERISKLSPAEYALAAAREERFWGEDLSRYEGFADTVAGYLSALRKDPVAALEEVAK